MINKLPYDLSNLIYKHYYTDNVLVELKKINDKMNLHYLNWSIFEHINYIKSLKKFSKKRKLIC